MTLNLQWTPCAKPPEVARRVLIYHRSRPWGRYFTTCIGWWNGREWRREDSNTLKFGIIYQPLLWKDFERPGVNPRET